MRGICSALLLPLASAITYNGDVTLSNSWPANDHVEAGAIWEFSIPAGMISNGTGSCSVRIDTQGVSFVHFFNAHVKIYDGLGTYEIYTKKTVKVQ